MAKKIDPKAKAKKQKIYAAIGGVLLIGLLAFQVPRTMKMLNPPHATDSTSPAPASTTSSTTGPIAAPSLSGGNATSSAGSVSSDGLIDSDLVPAPQSGQLLAFGLFRTKDPFAQQLDVNCATGGDSAGSAGSTCPSGGGSTTSKPPAKKPPSDSSIGVPTGPTPTDVAPSAAVISVNGISESVKLGAQFPASDPTFMLVSLSATTAKIGIAGGSLESGSQTVTLKKNTPLTLMNTADGRRYVLRLLSIS